MTIPWKKMYFQKYVGYIADILKAVKVLVVNFS